VAQRNRAVDGIARARINTLSGVLNVRTTAMIGICNMDVKQVAICHLLN
jgi:hypothetical protein